MDKEAKDGIMNNDAVLNVIQDAGATSEKVSEQCGHVYTTLKAINSLPPVVKFDISDMKIVKHAGKAMLNSSEAITVA